MKIVDNKLGLACFYSGSTEKWIEINPDLPEPIKDFFIEHELRHLSNPNNFFHEVRVDFSEVFNYQYWGIMLYCLYKFPLQFLYELLPFGYSVKAQKFIICPFICLIYFSVLFIEFLSIL